jgi:hypothetical protein
MGSKTKIQITALAVLLLGSLSPLALLLNQPTWLARFSTLGTIPLPLVFDAPKGYQFWSNQYHLSITTMKDEVIEIPVTKELYQAFPRNTIIFNALAIPLVMIPIQDPLQWKPVAQYLFCPPKAPLINYLISPPVDVKKVKITITGAQKIWQEEVKCL